ncbi:MAG: hypothetical protein AABX70_02820 [Nanoarchaeota archaeon]
MDRNLEREADRIIHTDWREEGIDKILVAGKPCPWQTSLDGTLYCGQSESSRGKCPFNTGEELLVPRSEEMPKASWKQYHTLAAKSMAAFGNRADKQNTCSYIPSIITDE